MYRQTYQSMPAVIRSSLSFAVVLLVVMIGAFIIAARHGADWMIIYMSGLMGTVWFATGSSIIDSLRAGTRRRPTLSRIGSVLSFALMTAGFVTIGVALSEGSRSPMLTAPILGAGVALAVRLWERAVNYRAVYNEWNERRFGNDSISPQR